MSASDFLLLYGNEEQRNKFDAVATVFFLDTAPNIIRYIEVIRNCLRTGGLMINIGPLLWHFENNAPGTHGHGGESSLEKEATGTNALYSEHPLLTTSYRHCRSRKRGADRRRSDSTNTKDGIQDRTQGVRNHSTLHSRSIQYDPKYLQSQSLGS